MKSSLRLHNDIIRACFRNHKGYEVKTEDFGLSAIKNANRTMTQHGTENLLVLLALQQKEILHQAIQEHLKHVLSMAGLTGMTRCSRQWAIWGDPEMVQYLVNRGPMVQ
eukprot:m51a1_g11 hypothetical protein (109) ;mRNA; f:40983-48926